MGGWIQGGGARKGITPSLPESIMQTCSVVLTFESVNEIPWCDHSNETSPAVFLHGTIVFQYLQNEIFLEFFLSFLVVKS